MTTDTKTADASARAAPQDSTVHWLLRGAQRLLRILLVISTIVAGVFLVFLGPVGVIPAIAMIACYLLVLLVNMLERKTRPGRVEARATPVFDQPPETEGGERPPEAPALETPARVEDEATPASSEERTERRVDRERRKAGLKVILAVVAALLVLALLVTFIVFEWRYLAIGAFLAFVFLLLTGAPFVVAAVHDQAEESEEVITGERAPSAKGRGPTIHRKAAERSSTS